MSVPLSVTVSEWLQQSESKLKSAGISTARLDSLVLLCDVLGRSKAWVLAYSDYKLQRSESLELNTKIEQRIKHVPIAYIVGKQEFFGRDFVVTSEVLVPRPESEAIIQMLKRLSIPDSTHIIDIGTGSGALAITTALELPGSHVLAVDISLNALDVANQNAGRLLANVLFKQSDLLQDISSEAISGSILLCNLPYVPSGYRINEAAKHEPELALFSGADGLGHYNRLFSSLADMPKATKPAHIITESLQIQHPILVKLAAMAGFKSSDVDGLVQLFSTSK